MNIFIGYLPLIVAHNANQNKAQFNIFGKSIKIPVRLADENLTYVALLLERLNRRICGAPVIDAEIADTR